MSELCCRFCDAPLKHSFADLGVTPLSNEYLSEPDLLKGEMFYPLKAYVCEVCFLVQLPEFATPDEIFSDYAYFSSYSDSFLDHARDYVGQMCERFGYSNESQVIEVASNDGYLLQYFKERGVPVLGIEPAGNVAKVAQEKGIPSEVRFFGVETARDLHRRGLQADLLLGNNVLAHVPDINDFVGGLKLALKPGGVITMEFPHLARLMDSNQFDTIYHEHFSYLSLVSVERVFEAHGLKLFDVEEIWTHGGSLRIYAQHAGTEGQEEADRLVALRDFERTAGFETLPHYLGFQSKIDGLKRDFLRFLIDAKEAGKSVVGYGAPAKGNTLLNYCGVREDLLAYTVDRSPHKQGQFLPGTRIPIYAPEHILETRPDYVVILPWNIRAEIKEQMSAVRSWGGRFVVPIPEVRVED